MYAIIIITILTIPLCHGELYTALSDMEDLLHDQQNLVDSMEKYIEAEKNRLSNIKNVLNDMKKDGSSSKGYIDHPINQFHLLRSIKVQYGHIQQHMNGNLTDSLLKEVESRKNNSPSIDDIQGAAQGIMRLQDTYHLAASNLASGAIRGNFANRSLTADDCFAVGSEAFRFKDHYHTTQWMMEADKRARRGDKSRKRVDILNILGFSLARSGNYHHANAILQELIDLYPDEVRLETLKTAQASVQKRIRDDKTGSIPTTAEAPRLTRIEPPFESIKAYEKICREGGIPRPPNVEKDLKCYLWSNNNPWLLLQPFRIEELWKSPHIIRFYDFVSDDESAKLIELAKPILTRSTVQDQGNLTKLHFRVSKSTWLSDRVEISERINKRITDATRLNTRLAGERMQIANYGIGGQFEPHRDYYRIGSESIVPHLGNRIASVVIYLTEVEHGGSTLYLEQKLANKAIKNSAVLWYNVLASGEVDKRTTHAGCPVLYGDKWIGNKLLRERNNEFAYPCKLEENADHTLF